jgi:hypothetical protein
VEDLLNNAIRRILWCNAQERTHVFRAQAEYSPMRLIDSQVGRVRIAYLLRRLMIEIHDVTRCVQR